MIKQECTLSCISFMPLETMQLIFNYSSNFNSRRKITSKTHKYLKKKKKEVTGDKRVNAPINAMLT